MPKITKCKNEINKNETDIQDNINLETPHFLLSPKSINSMGYNNMNNIRNKLT